MIPAVTDTLERTGRSRITVLGTRANHYWHVPSLEAAFTWRPADQIWVQAPMWHFRVDIDINGTLGPASYVNEDIDPWIEPSFIITRSWIYEETFVHHLFSSFFFVLRCWQCTPRFPTLRAFNEDSRREVLCRPGSVPVECVPSHVAWRLRKVRFGLVWSSLARSLTLSFSLMKVVS